MITATGNSAHISLINQLIMWQKAVTQNDDNTYRMTITNNGQEIAVFHSMPGEPIEKFKHRANALATDVIPDDLNPDGLFSITQTELLIGIINGSYDAVELAKSQLMNRGLDMYGKWVGFKDS